MTTRNAVDEFVAQPVLAHVGISRGQKGFGFYAWRTLRDKGYKVLPVNPHTDSIAGEPCYHSIAELPKNVGGLLITLPPSEAESVVRDAFAAGIRRVWLQQGAASEAALNFCKENGMEAVSGHCILMFAAPAGLHKFHHLLWNVIGKMPA